jgi:tRNA pseudouridine38-40 synthase
LSKPLIRYESEPRKPRELAEGEEKEPRRPKKKVACLIGYCGSGYHGMQSNPPQKTIEGDLFQAFVQAGAISKDNANDPKKSSFMRAARTDKGVHAAGNVVSLKLIVEDEDIVDKINSFLPSQIRVWGYSRTNNSFECRKMCNSRMYEYLIPSYSFLPPKPSSALAGQISRIDEELGNKTEKDQEGITFWDKVDKSLKEEGITMEEIKKYVNSEVENLDNEEESQDLPPILKRIKTIENQHRRDFRISAARLEKVREAFKIYEGTHNFHNFTLGKLPSDASAIRVMKSLMVSDPKVINGTEWLSIKIHGQSFMLHQIRKMVALAALVVRTGCPLDRISEAFGPTKINIPKAPSLGLLLERPIYDGYNTKLQTLGHQPITFAKWEKEMEEFKMKFIYDKIYYEEVKENVFHGFFAFIDSVRGDGSFSYLTGKGITAETSCLPTLNEEDKEELEGDNEG